MRWRLLLSGRQVCQSTAACLTAMTKGNLSAITLEHWKTALLTGFGAALIALLVTLISKSDFQISRWGVALFAFVGTFIVDLLNHPSHYELFWADEPLFTALGAGVLSLLISFTALDKVTEKLRAY